MELSVKLQGVKFAKSTLDQLNRKIDPVLRGTLNSTVTSARKEIYVSALLGSFRSRAFLNRRMIIKRARARRLEARIIPSSSGIGVTGYRSWSYQPIDATRARVFVKGPQGEKLAAGFVNPSSKGRKPLYTLSQRSKYVYSKRLQEAKGPSIAYWFKRLSTATNRRKVGSFMQREFARRMRLEIAKGVR